MNKVFAIIPGYNEEDTISDVVKKTSPYVDRTIVVNDGSKDNTGCEAYQAGADVIYHLQNRGKGHAMLTGIVYALAMGADIIVLLDADEQHDPSDIDSFVEMIDRGKAEMVFGCRRFNKKMPMLFRVGNLGLNAMFWLLHMKRIDDILCGYKAFKRETFNKIKWTSNGYTVEIEMAANALTNGVKFKQKKIKTKYLDATKGTSIKDGLMIGKFILRNKIKNVTAKFYRNR